MPPGRTTVLLPTLRRSLLALLKAPPRAYGWCRTRWSCATLALTLVLQTFMAQTAGPEWTVGEARLNGYNGMYTPQISIGTGGPCVRQANTTMQISATNANAIANGEQVKLSGFGNFDLRDKNQRPGRNPKTGEEIPISARRVLTFKPSQVLKNILNPQKAAAKRRGNEGTPSDAAASEAFDASAVAMAAFGVEEWCVRVQEVLPDAEMPIGSTTTSRASARRPNARRRFATSRAGRPCGQRCAQGAFTRLDRIIPRRRRR